VVACLSVRALDRWLQHWRIRKAAPWIRSGDRVLDVGCFDGSLAARVGHRVKWVLGIDPDAEPHRSDDLEIRRGRFPEEVEPPPGGVDCVVLLAVLEHVGDPRAVAEACHRALAPGGRVVLTVPHPFVDHIVDLLVRLRLADGMDLDAHHGMDPAQTAPVFEAAGFRLRHRGAFQLGLNRLFVFEKPAAVGS